jgi:hypothetical protein
MIHLVIGSFIITEYERARGEKNSNEQTPRVKLTVTYGVPDFDFMYESLCRGRRKGRIDVLREVAADVNHAVCYYYLVRIGMRRNEQAGFCSRIHNRKSSI